MTTAHLAFVVLALGSAIPLVSCKTNTISEATTNAGNTIGPEGGRVLGPDGASIDIPAGAVAKPTTFSIKVADGGYPAQPNSYNFQGKVYSFEPHGTMFTTPAIVRLPATAAASVTLMVNEQGTSTWTPVADSRYAAPTSGANGVVSGSAFGLSYWVVAGAAPDGGSSATCSGRGPDNGSPRSSQSLTGTLSDGPDAGAPLDLATVASGYSAPGDGGPMFGMDLFFASYANSCGYAKNGIAKSGSRTVTVHIVGAVTTQSYGPSNVLVSLGTIAPNDPMCGQSSRGGGGTNGAGTLTITAFDTTHIAGTFSAFVPSQGGGPINGSFDLPTCLPTAGLNPPTCCQ